MSTGAAVCSDDSEVEPRLDGMWEWESKAEADGSGGSSVGIVETSFLVLAKPRPSIGFTRVAWPKAARCADDTGQLGDGGGSGLAFGFTWFDPTDPRLGSSLREIKPIRSDWGDSGLMMTLGAAGVLAAAGAGAGDGAATDMAADGAVDRAVAMATGIEAASASRRGGAQCSL